MTRTPTFRLAPQTPVLPRGWNHPRLSLHRRWYARRVWQWRARIALALLAVLLTAVFAFGLTPYALFAALLGLISPTPLRPNTALRELEARGAQAYTTALVAPEDGYGLRQRLESQALAWQRQTDAPALPWLEGLAALALCSLLLAVPPAASSTLQAPRDVNAPAATRDPTQPPGTNAPDEAPPVLDAPSRAGAPDGDAARPGQAASGGTPGESQVGDLAGGGGRATEDPAEVSREFMEALERGAVNDRDSSAAQPDARKPNQPQVQDNDASAPARQGEAGGGQDQSSSDGGNGQGNQNRSGQSNPRGNQGNSGNAQNQPGSNGQPGTQPGDAGNSGGNGQQDASGAGNGQTRSGQNAQNGATRTPNGRGNPGADDGQNEDASGQGNGNNNPANRGQATRGGRGTSDPKAAERPQPNPDGKLEYLPGTLRGTQVRSGALQLPGDPRQPLTGTPGTPAFRRAAEGAVVDPKLPPEYQELLRNYYR